LAGPAAEFSERIAPRKHIGEDAAGKVMRARLPAGRIAYDDRRESLARHVGKLFREHRLYFGAHLHAPGSSRRHRQQQGNGHHQWAAGAEPLTLLETVFHRVTLKPLIVCQISGAADLFTNHPFPYVRSAMEKFDTVCRASIQKLNYIDIHQRYCVEIQHHLCLIAR
jgi:hypothetical protein